MCRYGHNSRGAGTHHVLLPFFSAQQELFVVIRLAGWWTVWCSRLPMCLACCSALVGGDSTSRCCAVESLRTAGRWSVVCVAAYQGPMVVQGLLTCCIPVCIPMHVSTIPAPHRTSPGMCCRCAEQFVCCAAPQTSTASCSRVGPGNLRCVLRRSCRHSLSTAAC